MGQGIPGVSRFFRGSRRPSPRESQGIPGVSRFFRVQRREVFQDIDQRHMNRTAHAGKLRRPQDLPDHRIEQIFRIVFRNSPMLSEKGPSPPRVPLIEQIEDGMNRAFYYRAVVVLDVSGQIAVIGPIIARIPGSNHRQRLHGTGYRHVQHPRIVHERCNDIVHGCQDDGIFFPALEFMNRVDFKAASQLFPNRLRLIPIRRDDSDAFIASLFQAREHLLPNHVDLPLIETASGMVPRRGAVHRQNIRLSAVFRHDDQPAAIKFLIAEIDDFRMTTVVFPQKNGGGLRPCRCGRGQQAVAREAIDFREIAAHPNFFALPGVFAVQHVRELPEIPHDDDISGAGKRQNARDQIYLGRLVHNEPVVDMIGTQGAFDGISGTQDNGILPIEIPGASAKIAHLEARPRALPRAVPAGKNVTEPGNARRGRDDEKGSARKFRAEAARRLRVRADFDQMRAQAGTEPRELRAELRERSRPRVVDAVSRGELSVRLIKSAAERRSSRIPSSIVNASSSLFF